MNTDLIARLREDADNHTQAGGVVRLYTADVEREAADALEACAKDAERYQWLRDGLLDDGMNGYTLRFDFQLNYGDVEEGLDAAIDAAMREGKDAKR